MHKARGQRNMVITHIPPSDPRADQSPDSDSAPLPANALQDRYLAALGLFASSTYKEYRPLVLGIGTLIALLLGWLLWLNRHRWRHRVRGIGLWLYRTLKFAAAEFRSTVVQKRGR